MLSLSYQIIYIRQKSPCADILQLIVDILFPLYSLFILFFIFKYCNVVINCKQSLAKVLLMHAMGTTLAFWIYSVVNETVNAINLKRFGEEKSE
jgi:ABC-type maltose transport system permease subunit